MDSKREDEAWALVFDYLPVESLKELLVIRRFRDVIMNNQKLMRKLPLLLDGGNIRKFMGFVEKHGHQVMKAQIEAFYHIVKISEILKVIKLLPNVEDLSLAFSIRGRKMQDHYEIPKHVKYPNLRTLNLIMDDYFLLPILLCFWECDELNSFKFRWLGSGLSSYSTEFILKQKNLKELHLTGTYKDIGVFYHPNFVERAKNVKFSLEKLNLKYQIPFCITFHEFLKTQSKVKELSVRSMLDYRYQLVIFGTFRNLKKLTLLHGSIECINNVEKLFDVDVKTESLDELTVEYKIVDPSVFTKLISFFPNIKKINLNNMTEFNFKCLDSLKYLEVLEAIGFKSPSLFTVKLPSLKKLKINQLVPFGSSEIWDNVLSCCPNLEIIDINHNEHFIDLFHVTRRIAKIELFAIFKGLKHLKNLKNLQIYLNIYEKYIEDGEDHEDLFLLYLEVLKTTESHWEIKISRFFEIFCSEELLYLRREIYPSNSLEYHEGLQEDF